MAYLLLPEEASFTPDAPVTGLYWPIITAVVVYCTVNSMAIIGWLSGILRTSANTLANVRWLPGTLYTSANPIAIVRRLPENAALQQTRWRSS